MSAGARLDLHVHSRYSRDARGGLLDLARAAKAAGLDGFALTDHDSVAGHKEARAAAKETGLVIVPGVEASCREGHVILLGVSRAPRKGCGLLEAVEYAHAEGGAAVAAHPLRLVTGAGPSVLERLAPRLDGAEARNARDRQRVQAASEALCRRLGLTGTGGSDVHMVHEVGTAWTGFPEPVASPGDVVEQLLRGRAFPGGSNLAQSRIWLHRVRRLGGLHR